MKSFLKKLFVTGVDSGLNFREKKDVIFVNQAAFILLVCSILVFVFNNTMGFHLRALVPTVFFFFFLLVFPLHKNRKYQLAKLAIISGALFTGVVSTFVFGAEAKTQYYLFPSFCLGMVLFNQLRHHIIIFVVHFVCFAFLTIYASGKPPLILGQDDALLSYFHLPVIFLAAFVTIHEFVMNYQRFENRINDLLKSVNEHSMLLEVEKSKFQVQTELLQLTNDQLVDEINHKEKIEKELIESNTSLEQFAYVASHDLKEPLRTIGSFTQLLERKLKGQFDENTQQYFDYITDGANRMTNLLDDLLALSSLNKQCEYEEIDMNQCVALNRLNLKNAIEKNDGSLVSDDLPNITANRSQMNQLFQNLISNGLKFKRDEKPVVTISFEERESDYLFSIRDNGIGMEEKYLNKIFVIFQRLDKKAQFEGTGIGLAICKKIVQNHKGKIWVESTVGEGTTFFFTISKHIVAPGETFPETVSVPKEATMLN